VGVTIRRVATYTDTIEQAHRTLGLRVFASPDEIKKAWRARAHETHPDHNGSARAFREVQAAAKVLLAEGAREFYLADARRAAATQRATTNATPPPTAPSTAEAQQSAQTPSRAHRRPVLLAAAMFGFVLAPHLRELGLTWDPLPFHDLCEAMQSLDWVFFAAWLWLRKPVAT
jgi:curved DNA-binding protein CbpA